MTTQSSRIFLYLIVASDEGDPSDITTFTELQPDKAWRVGDKIRSSLKYNYSGWKLTSGLPPSANFEDHLARLIERLKPAVQGLCSLDDKWTLDLTCSVYIYEATGPEVWFDSEATRFFTTLGASIGVDIYCLGDDTSSGDDT